MNQTSTATVRVPAVAGAFYPADRDELAAMVDGMLKEALARGQRGARMPPRAIIAPHAGFVYSGPIAASAYARFAPSRHTVKRVVLLGPAHRVHVDGLAVPSAEGFATPLGVVPIDRAAVARVAALPQVHVSDQAHASEHSLEVHLPFLQRVLEKFSLVPLVVGRASPSDVAEVLRALWGDSDTVIVVSSDLSHYHDYEAARRLDAATARGITAIDQDAVSDEGACGRSPIRGLLVEARRRGMTATVLDLRNSGDTAGPRDRVVGYGSFLFDAKDGLFDAKDGLFDAKDGLFDAKDGLFDAKDGLFDAKDGLFDAKDGLFDAKDGLFDAKDGLFDAKDGLFDAKDGLFDAKDGDARSPAPGTDAAGGAESESAPPRRLSDANRDQLINVAAGAIRIGLSKGHRPKVDIRTFNNTLTAIGASFITLDLDGRLKGCIGTLQAKRPLVVDVAWNAYAAAFEDKRFTPVTADEQSRLAIGVSVLGMPAALTFTSEDDLVSQLRPRVDGLILQDGDHRGTFLPQVWQQIPQPGAFLARLKSKVGLKPDHWSDDLKAWRYTTETFSRSASPAAEPPG